MLIAIGGVAVVAVVIFLIWFNQKNIDISGDDSEKQEAVAGTQSPITGQECEKMDSRPFAVMIAGDVETRPLSGLAQADLVVEMPVAPNGITRFMAIYQCEEPTEIGSIRSAREDFIPLVQGFKAIYAHWGGEAEALRQLNNHVIDNIDGMKYDGTVFYRKRGIPMPHNGFSTLKRFRDISETLKYSFKNEFEGYPHSTEVPAKSISNIVSNIQIPYTSPFNVAWQYDESKNIYTRSRGGTPEKDRNTGETVSASVVVTMKTTSQVLNWLYITVKTEGEGSAQIYQNGVVVPARWSKDPTNPQSKLYFYDSDGKEIKFAPGKIWIEIVT